MTNVPDLWPSDITTITTVAPVTMLRQQASRLNEKTKHVVEADVYSENRDGAFWHGFHLVAVALDNYKFRLFSIVHGIDFYPLEIDFFGCDEPIKVSSESDFIEALRKIFSSKDTKRVLHSLISQSQA
jgi:hypothetical protein